MYEIEKSCNYDIDEDAVDKEGVLIKVEGYSLIIFVQFRDDLVTDYDRSFLDVVVALHQVTEVKDTIQLNFKHNLDEPIVDDAEGVFYVLLGVATGRPKSISIDFTYQDEDHIKQWR